MTDELTMPIAGIENRTPQEVFAIMCDRIIASQADDNELLTIAWMDGSHRSTKAHRELIRNLRETGDRLAMFATHDQDCDSHMGHKVLPCNCGYTTAINAWKELGS